MSTHHRNEYLNEYLPRIADGQLTDALRTSGAVLIQGPKWCGKTATGARAAAYVRAGIPQLVRPLALLPVGFTEPRQSPDALVRFYRTVSPLPPRAGGRRFVFCGTIPQVTLGCC